MSVKKKCSCEPGYLTGDVSGVNRRISFFMHSSRTVEINTCDLNSVYDFTLPIVYLHVMTHPEWDNFSTAKTMQVPMTFKIRCGWEVLTLV